LRVQAPQRFRPEMIVGLATSLSPIVALSRFNVFKIRTEVKLILILLIFEYCTLDSRECRRTWLKLPNTARVAEYGSSCRIWLKLPNMAQVAEYGSSCRIWLKLPNMAQVAEYGSSCRIRLELPNMARVAEYGSGKLPTTQYSLVMRVPVVARYPSTGTVSEIPVRVQYWYWYHRCERRARTKSFAGPGN
jgi:hypothetical protein